MPNSGLVRNFHPRSTRPTNRYSLRDRFGAANDSPSLRSSTRQQLPSHHKNAALGPECCGCTVTIKSECAHCSKRLLARRDAAEATAFDSFEIRSGRWLTFEARPSSTRPIAAQCAHRRAPRAAQGASGQQPKRGTARTAHLRTQPQLPSLGRLPSGTSSRGTDLYAPAHRRLCEALSLSGAHRTMPWPLGKAGVWALSVLDGRSGDPALKRKAPHCETTAAPTRPCRPDTNTAARHDSAGQTPTQGTDTALATRHCIWRNSAKTAPQTIARTTNGQPPDPDAKASQQRARTQHTRNPSSKARQSA